MPEDGERIDPQEPAEKRVEVIELVEQRIELTEANKDSDVLNRGDSVIRRREGLRKTGRRIAKVNENVSLWLKWPISKVLLWFLSGEYLHFSNAD